MSSSKQATPGADHEEIGNDASLSPSSSPSPSSPVTNSTTAPSPASTTGSSLTTTATNTTKTTSTTDLKSPDTPPTTTSNSLPSSVQDADATDSDERDQENVDDEDDNNECSLFAIDFMFEGSQPSRMEHFEWKLATERRQQQAGSIQVALSIADDEPGDVQSGHYLWPGAKLLAEYLVQQQQQQQQRPPYQPTSVLELGAGCALLSLTALQLWQDSLQCVVVTDHDPGTLERGRNNYESTLQQIMEQDEKGKEEDEDNWMDDIINNLGSIPVLFESLEWKSANRSDSLDKNDESDNNNYNDDATRVRTLLEEHTNTEDSVADCILGSDLIYDINVVEPLLTTAARFLSRNKRDARFLLSQSFAYEETTEREINAVCQKLGLQRAVLWQDNNDNDNNEPIDFAQLLDDHHSSHEQETDDKGKAEDENTGFTASLAKRRIQEFRFQSTNQE